MIDRIRLAAALGATAATVAAAAPAAQAGPVVTSADDCAAETATQPFLPWLDPANYVLVDDGGFEAGGTGWTRRGATVGEGNEHWRVRAPQDDRRLELDGGSATTPLTCVGLGHPTMRFFARNTGAATGILTVKVVARTSLGLPLKLTIGTVSNPTRAWAPTLPMPVVANLLTLLPSERTRVAFEFTASGPGSAWQIDDVYVDPYSKR
jgi:hypothetical protein